MSTFSINHFSVMSQPYIPPISCLKPKISKRFYTYDSRDPSSDPNFSHLNSQKFSESKSDPKFKSQARNRYSVHVHFHDTADSDSFLSSEQARSTNFSAESVANFFVTRGHEGMFCEQTPVDYTLFRRNMRSAFNIKDLTSSEEISDDTDSSSDDESDYFDIDELMDGEGEDSAESEGRKLDVIKEVGEYDEDERGFSRRLWTEKKISSS